MHLYFHKQMHSNVCKYTNSNSVTAQPEGIRTDYLRIFSSKVRARPWPEL
jgi:hypothetical protein